MKLIGMTNTHIIYYEVHFNFIKDHNINKIKRISEINFDMRF